LWKKRPVPLFRQRAPQWDAATSDEDLVVLAQRGEREAFGALYDRYLPRVYAYCYRLLGNREAAEDTNTEVFMRALTALPAYRAGSFRSWLFAIAHNVAVDAVRQQHPTVPLGEAIELTDTGPSLEERAMAAVDRSTIAALLPRLSADQQHVVALRLSGLSATEIGDAMGKSRNAIDGLHHRALLRLRSLVATGETTATKGGG
jgi:RNA polymerase sigma-70 factor (ECF subfamily)